MHISKHEREQNKANREKLINEFIKNDPRGDYLASVPSGSRWLFYKVYTGAASRPQCMKAKCMECSSFNRDEITNCTVKSCPLYNIRPFRR